MRPEPFSTVPASPRRTSCSSRTASISPKSPRGNGGVGLYWESYERTGFDPVREVEVSATRRRVRVERELPMKDEYRAFLGELLQPIGSGSRRTV
ncbi:hypothetical protein [Amycolatopsis sp. cmx-4-54]|uniref:hypothetical protein n=1 Tax=Amycolatopsis sp. cmx-4-54 TaxID=2790936 RepID=UPI00397B404B